MADRIRFALYYARNWWSFGCSHRFAMAAAHADMAIHRRRRAKP